LVRKRKTAKTKKKRETVQRVEDKRRENTIVQRKKIALNREKERYTAHMWFRKWKRA
jgi:hypothetical protein